MVKKSTSFNLDKDLLRQIKLKAFEKDITQTQLITEYLIKGLKNDGVDFKDD